jgi:hypothetical protein
MRVLAQLLLALYLATVLALGGFVASSVPARAALAQGISTVSIAISHEVTHATSGRTVAVARKILCGSSSGDCP